jgi:hypothetical protein
VILKIIGVAIDGLSHSITRTQMLAIRRQTAILDALKQVRVVGTLAQLHDNVEQAAALLACACVSERVCVVVCESEVIKDSGEIERVREREKLER